MTTVAVKHNIDQLVRVGHYELHKTIGKGNFAVVKLATHLITKSQVAIKIIDKTALKQEAHLIKISREMAIMKCLRHRNIVKLYQLMETDNVIYMVTEYASNGEIFDYLLNNGRINEIEAKRLFIEIISAVSYCHSQGIVHRDLKAENLLLDAQMSIKLIDFGFSNYFCAESLLRTWCGSPPYAAPELFLGLEYDGVKADIWSLGVVLYAMVTGSLPFDGATLYTLKHAVISGIFRIPYFMSQECEHLIRHMLIVDPMKRYNMQQIQSHIWFQGIDFQQGSLNQNSATQLAPPEEHIINVMLTLPGIRRDLIMQSLETPCFDDIYAIYWLLYDKQSNYIIPSSLQFYKTDISKQNFEKYDNKNIPTPNAVLSSNKHIDITRRHTVGSELINNMTLQPPLLPNTNIHLMRDKSPYLISAKNPNLFKPTVNGFGRRVSDSATNMAKFWREIITPKCTTNTPTLVIPKFLQTISDGASVTLPSKTRRSGLLTVIDRPPVISPELMLEVETRMKRSYVTNRKMMPSSLRHLAPPPPPLLPSLLPTVQELLSHDMKSVNRFNPIKSTWSPRTFSSFQDEYQQLQDLIHSNVQLDRIQEETICYHQNSHVTDHDSLDSLDELRAEQSHHTLSLPIIEPSLLTSSSVLAEKPSIIKGTGVRKLSTDSTQNTSNNTNRHLTSSNDEDSLNDFSDDSLSLANNSNESFTNNNTSNTEIEVDFCTKIDSNAIYEIAKTTTPPKLNAAVIANSHNTTLIQFESGVEIEFKIEQQAIKMRRISGDQSTYQQLCQQFINQIKLVS